MITPLELMPNAKTRKLSSIRLPMGSRRQVVMRLYNDDGSASDLRVEPKDAAAPKPVFGHAKPATEAYSEVTLHAKNEYDDGSPVFSVKGSLLDEPGTAVFELLPEHTSTPGVYRGEVIRTVDGVIIQVWPCWITCEATLLSQLSGNGPLTIPEVRLILDDTDSAEEGVSLLDDVEFDDTKIIHAIKRVVDLWNATAPDVGTYTPANFPYRYYWGIGVVGELLMMRAASYRRNRLAYSAGGVSIDDQNKAAEYEQIGMTRKKEFMEWMQLEKLRLNMGYARSSGF